MEFKTVTIWEQATYIVGVPAGYDPGLAALKEENRVGVVKRVTGKAAGFMDPIQAVKKVADVSNDDLEIAEAALPEARPEPTKA